jgi:biotin carboxyl carrier protein
VVEADGVRRVAHGVRVGRACWVAYDGEIYVIEDRSRASARPADELGSLSAPMPATVVAVEVSAGQAVKAGDVLVRLEAMKMELPVRAPRDGTVVAIKCRAGELVQPGIPLLELAALRVDEV